MRKGLILGLVVVIVALAAIAALLYRPAKVIGVSGKSLAYSLRGEAGADRAACDGESDEFSCVLPAGEGTARYDVSLDDYGCWDATQQKGGAAGELPKMLSGCITIVDLVRLDD